MILLLLLVACGPSPAASPPSSAANTAQSAPVPESERSAPSVERASLVQLDRIMAERPDPVEGVRNPFRLDAAAVSPRPVLPPDTGLQPRPAVPPNDGPAAPRSPAVSLKFIGVVDAPQSAGRVAVLSDGRYVYHGRQDDVIDGRYKILKIGVESIEIEILSGGGRLRIRLTGS